MTQFTRRNIYLTIGFLFIIFGRFIPAPAGMEQSGMAVAGIFAGVLLLWLTVAIDWPSLLCIGALGLSLIHI